MKEETGSKELIFQMVIFLQHKMYGSIYFSQFFYVNVLSPHVNHSGCHQYINSRKRV